MRRPPPRNVLIPGPAMANTRQPCPARVAASVAGDERECLVTRPHPSRRRRALVAAPARPARLTARPARLTARPARLTARPARLTARPARLTAKRGLALSQASAAKPCLPCPCRPNLTAAPCCRRALVRIASCRPLISSPGCPSHRLRRRRSLSFDVGPKATGLRHKPGPQAWVGCQKPSSLSVLHSGGLGPALRQRRYWE